MLELMMLKKSTHLSPHDAVGMDEFEQIENGAIVKVKITQPRNLQHHRLWFALLQTVFEAQRDFVTLDEMHDAIKIAIGYFEIRRLIDGQSYVHPKSVSFSSMDQTKFRVFFDKAVDLIISKILPLTAREDLEQRVYDILGEPGPHELQRYSSGETHASNQ